MKSNTVSITAVALLVLIGLFVWGYSGKQGTTASVQGVGGATATASGLIASEIIYDFGTISMKDGNVAKEFEISNPTDQDITVSTVLTSCMCTTAFLVLPDGNVKGPFGMAGHGGAVPPANDVIRAGENRIIRVVYDPNAHGPAGVGQIERFVMLTDASGGTIELEIKALVTP